MPPLTNEHFHVIGKRLNTDSINYDTLGPKDKIYASIITAYKNTQSYKNKKEMEEMRITTEKYQLVKDTITYVASLLSKDYGDAKAEDVQIILKPEVANIISVLGDYLPEWEITPIPPNPDVAKLAPMPTIIRCKRGVL